MNRGMSPSAVAAEIGFSTGSAAGWKKGARPRKTAIIKIANYFNVPVEYFSEETEKSPAPKKGTEDFAKVYELLTPEHQEQIQEEILALLKKQMQG